MPKFGIVLYFVLNLASCIAFVKFNAKFHIAQENDFYVKMSNFDIGKQIWHCIRDVLGISWFFWTFYYLVAVIRGSATDNKFDSKGISDIL